jgi:transposase
MKDLGPVMICDRRWLIGALIRDKYLMREGKLIWEKRSNSFYLSVLVASSQAKPPALMGNEGIVSLDPGVRRFQQYYDPRDGTHGVLLDDTLKEIDRRCATIDKLVGKAKAMPWKDHPPRGRRYRRGAGDLPEDHPDLVRRYNQQLKRNCKRRLRRERIRLHNWKHYAHYDAINFLFERWDIVIASSAKFGRMAQREGRVFGNKTARACYNWSHYTFNRRLISKAAMKQKRVILIEERGTTKTCGLCGQWNAGVGDSKVYRCIREGCGVVIDRDINGARNNLFCAIQ